METLCLCVYVLCTHSHSHSDRFFPVPCVYYDYSFRSVTLTVLCVALSFSPMHTRAALGAGVRPGPSQAGQERRRALAHTTPRLYAPPSSSSSTMTSAERRATIGATYASTDSECVVSARMCAYIGFKARSECVRVWFERKKKAACMLRTLGPLKRRHSRHTHV